MVSDAQELVLEGLSALAAVLYIVVGVVQWRRSVAPESRGALRGFVIWWVGLGAVGLLGAALNLAGGQEALGLAGAVVYLYVILAVLCALLAGLLYYLLFVYTGRSWTKYVSVGFYALVLVGLVAFINEQEPSGFDENGDLAYANEYPPDDPVNVVVIVGLVGPPLVAAVAYFLLFFRVKDRTSRYRVLLVSGGIVLWFGFSVGSTLVRTSTGTQQGFAGQLTSQLLGLLAATMVMFAYLPPRGLQRALGIKSVLDEE